MFINIIQLIRRTLAQHSSNAMKPVTEHINLLLIEKYAISKNGSVIQTCNILLYRECVYRILKDTQH